MKKLTRNEIWRTSFLELKSTEFKSAYGYTHPNKDKNMMCVYCKNEDTSVVRDPAYIKDFEDYYEDRVTKFTVCHCPACDAVFSFFSPKGDTIEE